jgi:putative intracellular protease/amidase
MTHVSIVVPRESAVMESLVSVFTILDQANEQALAAGGAALFDVHLVGATPRVELYGGRFFLRPDLRLAETHSTDVVIVPAMAGNLADAVECNVACISWIQERYRGGAEVAGLCTAALFITGSGFLGDEHCSGRWFVDAAFRNEFSYMSLMVDRTTPPEGAISNTGAYSFFDCLLERSGGQAYASVCSSAFKTVFNRQCQSVLSIVDNRSLGAQKMPKPKPPSAPNGVVLPRLTSARFASMFQPKGRGRRGLPVLESPGCSNATGVNSATLRRLFKHVSAHRAAKAS